MTDLTLERVKELRAMFANGTIECSMKKDNGAWVERGNTLDALLALAERHLTPSPDIAGLVGRLESRADAWEPVMARHPAFNDDELLEVLREAAAALTRIGGEREKLHRATRFEFSEAGRDVCVEHRGDDRWCVRDGGQVLNRAGEWEHEPFSSARDDGFLARARFSLDEAFARAAALAEKKEELG